MMNLSKTCLAVAVCCATAYSGLRTSAAEPSPRISSLSKPAAGAMQMIFHGGTGPFQVQKRSAIDPAAPWYDLVDAQVTKINDGVYLATFGLGTEEVAFYRVMSVGQVIQDLKGWYVQVGVASPTNGTYFTQGERPTVTVKLLDTFAQGMSMADFSSFNLYMYGPIDPQKTVTASKLLNASTNRASYPHHYVDLKHNPGVQVNNNVLTYTLQPVTDEAPGTYVVSLWAVLASDPLQQIMTTTQVQIGNSTVESPLVTKTQCAACHEGAISGKVYLHHIDPGYSPVGNWSLDYDPVTSCKNCHNNDGYAAYTDLSIPGVTNLVADTIVHRVHGVHMGADLKLPANTNSVNGVFKDYTDVEFPADVRNCTKCHVDDRWKTQPTRLACGSCHDTTWFGATAQTPPGMQPHPGGPRSTDTGCWICHPPEGPTDEFTFPIATVHHIAPPPIDPVSVTMTPPANGSYYVAGEKPVVTLVFYDDTGTNAIDHTKVTDGNFSTASLLVYGPRNHSVPVLTSTARNVNSKLRASVTSTKPGPWPINGKIFKISINGSSPQEIAITSASNLVSAADVVASLNPVITNLNGGAKASVSGANVNIKTLIQGDTAKIEIYNGDVTTAMGWKRGPNTIMEPDVTIAATSIPANDLRALSDPLDYSDPMVTRTNAYITYQLDDVAGLTPGTYNIYVYHLPKPGKIPGLANPTGIGHLLFQVGTATPEKKIATNCKDCHGDTIWHLNEGPIHAEPFDTDYCNACHDYSHTAPGDMFKNQGGTSLNGWSGFGAMPIVRRVHGVHYAHYLEHPEEIYANATKDTFGGIIFPQDVRNCTKCHAESDTWKQQPSRMACLACHDGDDAKAHGKLMTWMADPNDPYGPGAVESCTVCHGDDAEFSPDKVHRITDPYVPPYPREPSEP